ncbi:MAG TPA: sulfatase-like hydrolase/transferase [Thermoanaerobaculia bacterium]|nr:sulfatase-like hydrolase/transferase [Thermoanaerobaculia bacterium]
MVPPPLGGRAVGSGGGQEGGSLLRRLAAVLALALLATGCNRSGDDTGAVGTFPGSPIIIISIDTLRSDRLPAYGYQGVETPALDALAQDSVLFERAYSHVPLTLPSHASLLTGVLPTRHGVRDNIGYRLDAAKFTPLQEVLRQAGYATGAAVSAYVLRAETGMDKGFDLYESGIDVKPSEALGRSQRSGGETARRALDWVKTLETQEGKPFFLFLHLYEPHTPYEPPEPFASKYRDRPYDGEIAAVDAVVGGFLDELRQLGTYDDAIIVLTSDHGEGLGEHGEREHGIFLYRESLQVPLLVKLPGARRGGTRVAAPVQLVDVMPTVLSLTGQKAPAREPLDGTSLFEVDKEGAPQRALYAETYYPRLHMGWSELTSVIQDRFHYIHGPDPELYDMVADTAEAANVLTRERRVYAALRQEAEARERPLQAPAEEDPETAAKLASLGYLGTASVAEGPLPDPKSRIHTLRDFDVALSHFFRQEYAEAVPAFQRVLAENPRMADGWENLGQSLQKLGRREEALAAYEKAMEVSGGSGHVALATGSLLLEMGRLGEARAHAELGLPSSPAAARSLLARVALEQGDEATAEREARAALAARGSRIGPLIILAQVLQAQGKLEESLEQTRLAEQELSRMEGDRKFAGLFFVQGDTLARMERFADAERAFQREIADFPGSPGPYSRLAVIYATQGRPAEAVGMLRRMVETNNSPAAYAEAVKTLRILGDPAGASALLRHALTQFPGSPELRALAG